MARHSFLALFDSGKQINTFSSVTIFLSMLTAIGLCVYTGPASNIELTPIAQRVTFGLLSTSFFLGLLQLYAAIRVAIDVRIFQELLAQAERRQWDEAPEAVLAEAIQAIKSTTPSSLIIRTQTNAAPDDPLDPYRRTATLFYKQIAFTLGQLVAYWASVAGIFFMR